MILQNIPQFLLTNKEEDDFLFLLKPLNEIELNTNVLSYN